MPDAANGAAHGLVPAFWGNGWYTGGPKSDPPEIDFPEWRGHQPSKLFLASYPTPESTNGIGNVPSPVAQPDTGIDLGAGYHVYGMLWTRTQVKWYLDGNLIGTATDGMTDPNGRVVDIKSNPISLILNNTAQLNGENVDASTVFPAHMLVDYVHVYSNDPSVRTATPESGYVPGGDGTALIDQSNQSEIDLMGLATADGYSYKNDMLDVLSGSKIIDTLRLTDQTPNGFVVEPPTSGGSVNIVAISDPLHPPPSLPNLTGLV